MSKKIKLSPNQIEVINLMKEGWELGRNCTSGRDIGRQWWMQKGGLGRGGEAKTINSATAWKLYHLGLITKPNPNLEFPTEHWALTEEGQK